MKYLESGLDQLLTSVFGSIPSVVFAVILLILAFILASVIRALVVRLCKRLKLDKRFSKYNETAKDGGEINSLIQTFGKIVFILVFLLFLPGILNTLQLQGVSQPISDMMHSVVGYLPNIIAAAAIFFIGMYIAKIIRQIVTSLLKRVDFKKLQQKAGVAAQESAARISALAGHVVYALILIPVTVAALQVLNIETISVPAINMLNSIFLMLPNVVIAIVLIVIGVFIGKLAGSLLSSLLSGLGIDGMASKFIKDADKDGKKILISDILGGLVKYIVILLLVIQAFDVLHLDVLNNLGAAVVTYLPSFIGALIIFGAGLFFASFAEKAMKKYASGSAVSAGLVKTAILVMTVFMTLNQLQIASLIVDTTFIVILGAAAVAFAIAFGIGGRDMASAVLKGVRESLRKKEETPDGDNS